MQTTADRHAAAREALGNLTELQLDAVFEAIIRERDRLAAQVREADNRAIAKGACKRMFGDGYAGQHDSTNAKRDTVRRLDEALPVVEAAMHAAWWDYTDSLRNESEVAA